MLINYEFSLPLMRDGIAEVKIKARVNINSKLLHNPRVYISKAQCYVTFHGEYTLSALYNIVQDTYDNNNAFKAFVNDLVYRLEALKCPAVVHYSDTPGLNEAYVLVNEKHISVSNTGYKYKGSGSVNLETLLSDLLFPDF